ncbi:uncharacterized protein LOC128850888 isoform X4 [Cuculus canorus]|uniref:uncharacterized protein LOC128850888 isoform X4 n=1 Tax=Cuculus canorus TaxID=55661 RepID=UPI0023AAC982|nr:uncharacterized protein LOC128850888 isoform X4 [Cuculus canorus]
MCLLSITENGEVSVCSGQGRLDRGPSSLGAELTLLLPTGLIPKDYRSLKTQYLQSYGPEHLLTFHNLKRIGLLTEQSAAETLTAVESRVSKLVTDRAAAESQPSAPGELGAQPCPAGSCCSRAGWKHAAKVDTAGTELRAGQSFGPWEQQGWQERSQMHLILWPERAIFQLEARSWGWDTYHKSPTALPHGAVGLSPTALPDGSASWCCGAVSRGSPPGFKFIFLTTAITNSARMMEAMIEAKA